MFFDRPAVIISVALFFAGNADLEMTTSFLDGDELIGLNSCESLNQTIGPVNLQIGMATGSQPEMKPAIVH